MSAEQAAVSDPEVQEDVLALTLAYRRREVPSEFPVTGVLGKLLVNGKQIGLISYFEVKLSSDKLFPEVLVHICGGLPKDAKEACSDLLKVRARECIAELRKFPFVRIESPFLDEGVQ